MVGGLNTESNDALEEISMIPKEERKGFLDLIVSFMSTDTVENDAKAETLLLTAGLHENTDMDGASAWNVFNNHAMATGDEGNKLIEDQVNHQDDSLVDAFQEKNMDLDFNWLSSTSLEEEEEKHKQLGDQHVTFELPSSHTQDDYNTANNNVKNEYKSGHNRNNDVGVEVDDPKQKDVLKQRRMNIGIVTENPTTIMGRSFLGCFYVALVTRVISWLVYVNILIRPKDYLPNYFPYGAIGIRRLHQDFPILPIIGDWLDFVMSVVAAVGICFFSFNLLTCSKTNIDKIIESKYSYLRCVGAILVCVWIYLSGCWVVHSFCRHFFFWSPALVHGVIALISCMTVGGMLRLFAPGVAWGNPWRNIHASRGLPFLTLLAFLNLLGLLSSITVTPMIQSPAIVTTDRQYSG
ncbi:hypothetical protein NEHOM01_1960 [Nematocida homosporus]|uniref:uncharacterized protein n=1 Tax=Nematocida homosporus TaxID=1912981 RepID=UPI002220A0B2|nr:uncharacterized protein NEHOM01_1960 [Nematocida homosporus]KAI5187134.1 hypothetical protein NEHOM01_1960 [Nematocida homosporus]